MSADLHLQRLQQGLQRCAHAGFDQGLGMPGTSLRPPKSFNDASLIETRVRK
jgi:hypothetical protein